MKAQELPQVEPSPWCWKDVRCLSLFIRCMCGLFLAVLCGAAAGGIYTVMKRCTMVQAAQQIDRFGFQERIVTAYGRIGKEGSIDRMQRSDAVHMLQEDHAWKKARVCPDRRKLVALFLSLGLALVLSFVPSPAHKQAQQRQPSGRKPGKGKRNPKSDGCLKTD